MSDRIRLTRLAKALIAACHPAPTVAVTAIAVLLGVSYGLDASWLATVAITVLVGQLSIGWSNDWWDASQDAASGRTDKPAARGDISAQALRAAAFCSAAIAVPLSFVPGRVGAWHVVLIVSGWSYNLALKGTAWSPLPYFVGFGALPLYVAGVSGVQAPWWMVTAGAMLGVAAHFANAAPDIDEDRAAGVLGLPQRIGRRPSVATALGVLACAGALLLASLDPSGAARIVAVIVVGLPLVIGSALVIVDRIGRPVFLLVMAAAVVDVVLLTAAA